MIRGSHPGPDVVPVGGVDQLCLSPQCGFSSTLEGNSLSRDQQVANLRLVVETAEEMWGTREPAR